MNSVTCYVNRKKRVYVLKICADMYVQILEKLIKWNLIIHKFIHSVTIYLDIKRFQTYAFFIELRKIYMIINSRSFWREVHLACCAQAHCGAGKNFTTIRLRRASCVRFLTRVCGWGEHTHLTIAAQTRYKEYKYVILKQNKGLTLPIAQSLYSAGITTTIHNVISTIFNVISTIRSSISPTYLVFSPLQK